MPLADMDLKHRRDNFDLGQRDGTLSYLYLVNYIEKVNIMKDSFGRKINYLRISVTDLCNLRCRYCMPEEGIYKVHHKDILSIEEIEEIVKVFVSLGVDKIRLTGGEPLIRSGIIDIVQRIGKLAGVKDLAMTTNGILLKRYAKDLKAAGLNRVNISLDTLDKEKYAYITRGGRFQTLLDGIEAAKKSRPYSNKDKYRFNRWI